MNMWVNIVDISSIELALYGARLSYNSEQKRDSTPVNLGDADYILAKQLVRAGSSHSKFMRAIQVSVECNMPLYWHKQLDQYKIGTTSLSTSTIHKLKDTEEFTQDNFSTPIAGATLHHLNKLLATFKHNKEQAIWYTLIASLPSGYLQKRLWIGNLEVVRSIYQQRQHHQLPEWKLWNDAMEKGLPERVFNLCTMSRI